MADDQVIKPPDQASATGVGQPQPPGQILNSLQSLQGSPSWEAMQQLQGGGGLMQQMMMMPPPQPASLGLAAGSGMLSGLAGQPTANPYLRQLSEQQDAQDRRNQDMLRLEERMQDQRRKQGEAAFEISSQMMQSDDPDIRKRAAQSFAVSYQMTTGMKLEPEFVSTLVKRGMSDKWQQDFIFDSQARNEDGQPIYDPKVLADRYDLTEPQVKALMGRQRDPNYMRKILGEKWKSPEDLYDEHIGRIGKKYDNLGKLFPDLRARPELYSAANKHYRAATGTDLVTAVDNLKDPSVRDQANRAIELGKADLEQQVLDKEERQETRIEQRGEAAEQRAIRREGRAEDRAIDREARREEQRKKEGKLTASQSARRSSYESQGQKWVTRRDGLSSSLAQYTGADADERDEILQYYAEDFAFRKMQNDPLFRGSDLIAPESAPVKPESVTKYEQYLATRRADAAQPSLLNRLTGGYFGSPGTGQPQPPQAPTQGQTPAPAAPGQQPKPAAPLLGASKPPAKPTKDAAMAEVKRLISRGLSQADAIAAMRRSGWDVK